VIAAAVADLLPPDSGWELVSAGDIDDEGRGSGQYRWREPCIPDVLMASGRKAGHIVIRRARPGLA
jgi:hypothetical protein